MLMILRKIDSFLHPNILNTVILILIGGIIFFIILILLKNKLVLEAFKVIKGKLVKNNN